MDNAEQKKFVIMPTYMLKLNLQFLTLFSQIQKLPHGFILLFPRLLKISSELCDDVISFFDSSLKFLQLEVKLIKKNCKKQTRTNYI